LRTKHKKCIKKAYQESRKSNKNLEKDQENETIG
jgi:hypothetical protein